MFGGAGYGGGGNAQMPMSQWDGQIDPGSVHLGVQGTGHTPFGGGSRMPHEKPGDWYCPQCNDLQFARNASCRKCGEPNPNPEASMAAVSGLSKPTPLPGDWHCPNCNDLQFAKNNQCRKCGTPNPTSIGKPGDWFCPSCHDHQFAKNITCRKCGTPNPAVQSGVAFGIPSKAGDWHCPSCHDLQFARNAECRKCQTPNPDPEGSVAAMENGMAQRPEALMRPGDWLCSSCGDLQFARNMECRKCQTPNPDPESSQQALLNAGAPKGGMVGFGKGKGKGKGAFGRPMLPNRPMFMQMQMQGQGQGPQGNSDSWSCSGCNVLVFKNSPFVKNNQCPNCGTPGPGGPAGLPALQPQFGGGGFAGLPLPTLPPVRARPLPFQNGPMGSNKFSPYQSGAAVAGGPPATGEPPKPCVNFMMNGACKWGNNCWDVHAMDEPQQG